MRKRSEDFGLALRRVREALHLPQDAFGARLGVSRRTLTRWEAHGELPPIGQRKHLATSVPDVPSELRAALVRSLGLDDSFVAAVAAPRPDGAFLELSERLDVPPARLRPALVEFLRRVEAMGLSLPATRDGIARQGQ